LKPQCPTAIDLFFAKDLENLLHEILTDCARVNPACQVAVLNQSLSYYTYRPVKQLGSVIHDKQGLEKTT